MKKGYLITAILLLSSVWLMAQSTPSSSQQPSTPSTTDQSSPSTTSPSQSTSTTQTTTTDTTQTSSNGSSIEGCLSGSAGSYTLTDTTGKTWQLAGDTSKLTEHVGHDVRLTGSENNGGAAGSSSGASGSSASSTGAGAGSSGAGASGSQSTFNVQKVKMISSTCPTGK
ncbi:MAG TPA: hypothetical protein VFB76_07040 [Candidatus Angelobacter sp.]|nr:hypothetical protein [Candidatus Angelobacter sp.]